MKRSVLTGALFLTLAQIALLPSCTSELHIKPDTKPAELDLSYTIIGATEDELTRGLPGTANENKIAGLYTLFFEDGTNKYIGCVHNGINSSAISGTSRIGIPDGYTADDPFTILFVANIDAYVDKGAHATVSAYFDALLAGLSLTDASELLMAGYSNTNGIRPPLPMSAKVGKPAGVNSVSAGLKRMVARIDVLNTFTTEFEMVSAQVWNARNEAYIMEHGMPPSAASFTKYKGNVQNAVGNTIKTGLYFFENYVYMPVAGDVYTTCLIIGGYYRGGSLKYWRVNIYPGHGSQHMLRNHLYNIKITKVLSDGDEDPEDAYNSDMAKIEYIVNDWEDDFQGGYIVDKYGNGLALSKRSVIFSGESEEEEVIEVMRIYGNSEPILEEWTIDPVAGKDPDVFETEIIPESPQARFKVRTKYPNITAKNRVGDVTVRWGGLSATVSLKQLTPLSQVQGMRATPSNIWFPADAGAGQSKQFMLDVLGNHYAITNPATDIQTAVIWGTNDFNWFTVNFDADMGAGIYRFNISPTPMPAGKLYRDATVKLTVLVEGIALSASVYVKQSEIEEEVEISRRQIQVLVYRSIDGTYTDDDYEMLGTTTEAFSNFAGFPQEKVSPRDLHFSLNEKRDIKYKIKLTSSLSWWIEPKMHTASRLDFSMTRYSGNNGYAETSEIWITANKDIVNDAANSESSAWGDAWFDLCFENGDRETFYCHQRGVLAMLPKDGKTYYYETAYMNGRYWLDRNLGATSNGFYNGATGNGDHNSVGIRLKRNEAVCPKGFRLPKRTSANMDEWDWFTSYIKYNYDPEIPHLEINDPENLYYNSFSVEYSQSPYYARFYLPQDTGPEKAKDLSSYWEYENDMVLLLNGTSTSGPGTTIHIGTVDGGRYLVKACDHWSVAGSRSVVYYFNGLHFPDYGSGPCNQIYTEIAYRTGGGACINLVAGIYDCNYSLARCIRDE